MSRGTTGRFSLPYRQQGEAAGRVFGRRQAVVERSRLYGRSRGKPFVVQFEPMALELTTICSQFKLGFESARREVEQERSDFLGGFLDSTLVSPSSPIGSNTSSKNKKGNHDPLAACNLQQQHSAPSTRAIQSQRSPLRDLERAALRLKDLTKSSAAALFDLRSFRAPLRSDYELPFLTASSLKPTSSDMGAGRSVAGSSRPPSPRTDGQELPKESSSSSSRGRKVRTEKTSTGMGRVYLLGGAGSVDWEETTKNPALLPATVEVLDRFYRVSRFPLDSFFDHFTHLPRLAIRRIKLNSILHLVTRLSNTFFHLLLLLLPSFQSSTSMDHQLSSSFSFRTKLISNTLPPTKLSFRTLEQ